MFLILLAATAVTPVVASAEDRRSTRYIVRKDETLTGLAARYLVSAAALRQVMAQNKMPVPRKLRRGETLVIPYVAMRWTPVTARIASFRGSIAVGGRTAGVGTEVGDGAQVATAADSFAAISFPDGTIATLPSNSSVRIVSLRRYLLTGEVDRRFLVQRGGSTWQVTPAQAPGDRFEVRTPVAVAAVRGTEFRVTYDDSVARSGAGVVKGEVGFATEAASEPTALPKGFGALTDRRGVIDKRALLAAPELRAGYDLQRGAALEFAVIPVPGGTATLVEIARDSGFFDSVTNATVAGEAIALPSIPDGAYFIRASAIDDGGLQGLSATYAFKRRLSLLAVGADGSDKLRFSWTAGPGETVAYRFVLSTREDLSSPLIDVPGLTTNGIVIGALPKGKYFWSVVTLLRDGTQTSQSESFQAGGK